jgi:GntR family transcriptional repressor for pyruvate dehydrogenase complex
MKHRKLADSISDRVRQWIMDGVLSPGDRIQSERALSDTFAVSRPIVREALATLEGEGLLDIRRGGLHVRELTASPIVDPLVTLFRSDPSSFDDYLEFREIIEGAAAYFAALRATEIDRDNLQKAFDRFVQSHDAGNPGQEAEMDAAFHVAIYEACHNRAILHVMRGTSGLLRNDVFFNRSRLYPRIGYREATIDQHRLIFDAIMNGKPDSARAAAAAHIVYVRRAVDELKKADARLEIARQRQRDRQTLVGPE